MSSNRSVVSGLLLLTVVLCALAGSFLWLRRSHLAAVSAPNLSVAQPDELSHSVDIDVYVDGSGSMKNFLQGTANTGDTTNFLHEFLSKCESAFRGPTTNGGWGDPQITFWKFGGSATMLPDTGGLSRLADNPDGYLDHGKHITGFKEGKTSIEEAVNHRSPERAKLGRPQVKIIITDLYQSDLAPEQIDTGLAKQYLDVGGAVAVYGIRNPYNSLADVDDLPGIMHGKSLPKAADSMPFYIILAGNKPADVYHAQEVMMSGSTGSILRKAIEQKLAFVSYFSKDPGSIDTDTPQISFFASGKKIGTGVPPKDSSDTLLLRGGKAAIKLSSLQTRQIAVGNEEVLSEDLESRVMVSVTQKNDPAAEDRDAERSVSISPCIGEPLSVCATIDRSYLHSGLRYMFQFDLLASKPKSCFTPDSPLMKRWNIEVPDLDQIAAHKDQSERKFPPLAGAAGEHAGLTPKLSQFLLELQGQMFHVKDVRLDPVRVATYYLFVKAG